MSKFDLEKALKGEPVVLRNGVKAYVRHHETELRTNYSLTGFVVNENSVSNTRWMEDGHFYLDKGKSGYDIIGMWHEPLVFEHWGLLREDIKYLAKDGDGGWYGYGGKPIKTEECWNDQRSCGFYPVDALKPSLFPECDWKDSLIERPENE